MPAASRARVVAAGIERRTFQPRRAWREPVHPPNRHMRQVIRRAAAAVGILFALLILTASIGWGVSSYRIRRSFDFPVARLDIPTDSASIARGRHLAGPIAKCVDCHGTDFGGKVVVDAPAIGLFAGPNLTTGRGGIGGQITPEQFARLLRHGVRRDGHPVIFMPSESYQFLADADIAALYAFLRTVPPVDREPPPTTIGPVIRALNVAGQVPLAVDVIAHDSTAAPKLAPTAGPTAEYGRYLAEIGGCTGCHGPGLSGGRVPGTPPDWKPASNLTPAGIGSWSEADFTRALRQGLRPGGTPIDTIMPWRLTRQMTDDEIGALYAFLKGVPPKAFGNR